MFAPSFTTQFYAPRSHNPTNLIGCAREKKVPVEFVATKEPFWTVSEKNCNVPHSSDEPVRSAGDPVLACCFRVCP